VLDSQKIFWFACKMHEIQEKLINTLRAGVQYVLTSISA